MSYNPAEKNNYPMQPGVAQNYAQPAGYPSNVVVQQPTTVAQPTVRPPDYLVLSIIGIFCCWPMAICAIMYSMNSRSAADANDYSRALAEGRTARNIGIATIVVGIVLIAIVLGVTIPLAIAAASVASSICTGFGCDY